MNKASCLSLVSNAILMWNTVKIDGILKNLEAQGETTTQEALSHVSLLPFKHVLPNGTYFIEEEVKRRAMEFSTENYGLNTSLYKKET